jgi:hypothetical protein
MEIIHQSTIINIILNFKEKLYWRATHYFSAITFYSYPLILFALVLRVLKIPYGIQTMGSASSLPTSQPSPILYFLILTG